ncbi:hypothetical protein BDQ17DRAFT_1439743 [Cyathus striatus]|nr:hypothetical protein BDQ17DRAFT_1439743 [Cyathus striatus]
MKTPLKTLKAGLVKAKQHIKEKHNALLACLMHSEKISEEEEAWLDHGDGNLAEETVIVDNLDHASGYEQGLSHLNSQQESLVEKLRDLGKNITGSSIPGRKRKNSGPIDQTHTPARPQVKSKTSLKTISIKKEIATPAQ